MNKDTLNLAIGNQEADYQCIMVWIDEHCGLVVCEADHQIHVVANWWLRRTCFWVDGTPRMSSGGKVAYAADL